MRPLLRVPPGPVRPLGSQALPPSLLLIQELASTISGLVIFGERMMWLIGLLQRMAICLFGKLEGLMMVAWRFGLIGIVFVGSWWLFECVDVTELYND